MTRHDRLAHMAATLLAAGRHYTIQAAVEDALAIEAELEARLAKEDAKEKNPCRNCGNTYGFHHAWCAMKNEPIVP